MINFRQVSTVQKDGNQYTLIMVKVTAENPVDSKSAMSAKEVNTTFANVSDLFDAIQQHTVDLVASGLI